MIILDTTSKALKLKLGAAHTTSAGTVFASWTDWDGSTSYVPGSARVATNGTTLVTVVAAPASGHYRKVTLVSYYNADTVSQTPHLIVDDGSNQDEVLGWCDAAIAPSKSAVYDEIGSASSGAGGGSIDAKESGSTVVSGATSFDFGTGFDVTNSGGSAVVALDLTENVSGYRTALQLTPGTDVQAYDADLAAVAALSSSGLIARTGAGTAAARTLQAGTGISITNGDGVSGDPTIGFGVQGLVGHRLSLETGVAISTADQTGKTTIYLTPYLTSLLALYSGSGSVWTVLAVPEIGIALGTLTSGKNYDVYAFTGSATPSSTDTGADTVSWSSAPGWASGSLVRVSATGGGLTAGTDYWYNAASSTSGSFHTTLANALAGTSKVNLTANITASITGVSLEFSAAWSSDTARTDAYTTQDGILVKSGAATRLLLGTFRTTATTTTEDSAVKRFVANLYNVVRRPLVKAVTSTWAYATASWRQAKADASYQVEVLSPLGMTYCEVQYQVLAQTTTGISIYAGVGLDSTSAVASGSVVPGSTAPGGSTTNLACLCATYRGRLSLGYHYLAALEYGNATTAPTFNGTIGQLASGMTGSVDA